MNLKVKPQGSNFFEAFVTLSTLENTIHCVGLKKKRHVLIDRNYGLQESSKATEKPAFPCYLQFPHFLC